MMELIEEIFKNADGDINFFGKIAIVVLMFSIIGIINKFINKIIDTTFNARKSLHLGIDDKRATTLISILKKVINYFIIFIGIIIALEMFNIDTKSILATAGIGGIAIGFGAQSLVKDIITGFFILMENQYSVGDYIETAGFDGIVEEVGVRVTKIRSFSGDLHIIPNGIIQSVTNRNRGPMRALINLSIAYEEDIDRAISVLENTCEEIRLENDKIVEGPTVLGVTSLGNSDVVLTIMVKTKPMEQWVIERDIRKKGKQALDKAGIEIPYPRIKIEGDKK